MPIIEERHMTPIDDEKPHLHSRACECQPEFVEDLGAWVHNAFDHREIVIGVEVFLGFRCQPHAEYCNEEGEHISMPPPHYEYQHANWRKIKYKRAG